MKLLKNIKIIWISIVATAFVFCLSSVAFAQSAQIITYIPNFAQKLWRTWGQNIISESVVNQIKNDNFVIVPSEIRQNEWRFVAHQIIRKFIIEQVLDNLVFSFVKNPFTQNANYALTVRSGSIVSTEITKQDDLDKLIDSKFEKLGRETSDIAFGKDELLSLWNIYLRKSTQDLKDLWYEVLSSRYRTNTDPAYRRHNIVTAFSFLGHTKVLNPGESFWFLASIHYDPKTKKNYKDWLAIVDDEEIPVYGWGICGGSTALYQGILTNKWLKVQARNHSKRFSELYPAIINGLKITTPGLDGTVFAGSVDVKVTNISDYPIIIVLNYNGQYNGIEEIMSLWLAKDKGSLEFVGKKSNCYTRNINGVNKTSCYKEVH